MSDWQIELHGVLSGNSLRVSIALEEAAIPYTLCLHSLLAEEEESLAARGPFDWEWQEPVMVEHRDNGSLIMFTESTTMLYYIATKCPGTLIPLDPDQRALVYSRLGKFIVDGAPSALWSTDAARTDEELRRCRTDTLCAALAAAEPFVSTSAFMAGENFSLVDIAAYTVAVDVEEYLDWGRYTGLCRWFKATQNRPSVVRGVQAFVEPQAASHAVYRGVPYRIH